MLQCVAVCCSVLPCVAVFCSVLQRDDEVCLSVSRDLVMMVQQKIRSLLQCLAVCRSVF